MQRMCKLATQGNNDSLNSTQRGYIATGIDGLSSEINQVGTRTTLNGKSLLSGLISDATGTGTAQVGTASSSNCAAPTFVVCTFSASFISTECDSLAIAVGSSSASAARTGTQVDRAHPYLYNDNALKSAVPASKSSSAELAITALTTGTASAVTASFHDVDIYVESNVVAASGAAAQVGTAASSNYLAASSNCVAVLSKYAPANGRQFEVGTTSTDNITEIGFLFNNVKFEAQHRAAECAAIDQGAARSQVTKAQCCDRSLFPLSF